MQLTFADHIDVPVVVTVMDTPAGKTALGQVCFVPQTVDLREPDDSSTIAIGAAIASTDGFGVAKHSGREGGKAGGGGGGGRREDRS